MCVGRRCHSATPDLELMFFIIQERLLKLEEMQVCLLVHGRKSACAEECYCGPRVAVLVNISYLEGSLYCNYLDLVCQNCEALGQDSGEFLMIKITIWHVAQRGKRRRRLREPKVGCEGKDCKNAGLQCGTTALLAYLSGISKHHSRDHIRL